MRMTLTNTLLIGPMNLDSWAPLLTIVASTPAGYYQRAEFFSFLEAAPRVEEQLETARRQLEEARQGPRSCSFSAPCRETSDHLKILDRQSLSASLFLREQRVD
jgi:hypothetical protein